MAGYITLSISLFLKEYELVLSVPPTIRISEL